MLKKILLYSGIGILVIISAYVTIVFVNQMPQTEKYDVDGRTIELTTNMCGSVGAIRLPSQEFEEVDTSSFMVLTRGELDEVPKFRDAIDVANTREFPLVYSISTFDLYAKELIDYEN